MTSEKDSVKFVSFVLPETEGQVVRLKPPFRRDDLMAWFVGFVKDALLAEGFDVTGTGVIPQGWAGLGCRVSRGSIAVLILPNVSKDPRSWQITIRYNQSALRRWFHRNVPAELVQEGERLVGVIRRSLEELNATNIRWLSMEEADLEIARSADPLPRRAR